MVRNKPVTVWAGIRSSLTAKAEEEEPGWCRPSAQWARVPATTPPRLGLFFPSPCGEPKIRAAKPPTATPELRTKSRSSVTREQWKAI